MISKVHAVLAALAFPALVTGHSWVSDANGGVQRGGLSKDDDSHNTHYFCPTSDLNACQPASNTHIQLSQVNQLPCGGLTEFSNPMGQATAGGQLVVKWPGNGHTGVDSCVTLYYAPMITNPSFSDFKQLGDTNCFPYSPTEATLTLPDDMPNGNYTLFWLWPFASFNFSSCVDFTVSGGSSVSTTTPAPLTTPSPAEVANTPTMAPNVHPDAFAYKQVGCNNVQDDFCKATFGHKSYCKNRAKDSCGRSVCEGDSMDNLEPCAQARLLL